MKNGASKSFALFIAAVTCPCHIFILAALLAGTALGIFISNYFIPLIVIFSTLFLISLVKIFK